MGDFARSYCSGYGGDDGGKCRRGVEGREGACRGWVEGEGAPGWGLGCREGEGRHNGGPVGNGRFVFSWPLAATAASVRL